MIPTGRRVCAMVIATLLIACRSEAPKPAADLILTGGLIWSGPATVVSGPDAPTAIAVAGGKIMAVGSDAEIERLAGSASERIELAGRRVVPGFIDSHTHFVEGGFELAGVQLRDAATPEAFARRIGAFAAAHPGEWVLGGQWDHELWGGALPRRDWIDSLAAGTPVFVRRLDGHMGLANSRALELAGIGAATADPPGGTIVRYPDGRPTGILKDEAQSLIFRVVPAPTEAERDRALNAAVEHALSRGVTMIADMGSWEDFETYRRARARGDLRIRVYGVVPLSTWQRLAQLVADEGRGDDRLFWGGLKDFVDGSLGSTTAWFYQPYDDAPGTSGLVITDTTELRQRIISADSAGLQVMVHAIGDRANDWLLETFATAREVNGRRDRRFRIEHAQHLTRDAIDWMGRDEVIASMQPYHAIDDGRWAERRIGPERIKTTYPFRSLLDAGVRVAFGSDWTVAPIDPLAGIYAAVTRRTIDGFNPQGWVPDEKTSVAEAVTAYTRTAAFAAGKDGALGDLSPGKYADLVVLSADIFSIKPEDIEAVQVDLTLVEGEVAYRRPG